MKKLVFSLLGMFALTLSVQAQEVKTDIEVVDTVKTVIMTINADRFQDLKDFDWHGNLVKVFKDVPDEALIGIRVNIGAKQLTDDIATLNNKMSLIEYGTAINKEKVLRNLVNNVKMFIDDDQQGHNIEPKK